MRAKILFAVASLALFGVMDVSARAGLINPTSTVDPLFDYIDPILGPQAAPSSSFSTGTSGPFSLAAPITPPTTPLYTTEPFNIAADAGFWFTDTQVTIYNNAGAIPFCTSSSNAGSSCTDPYNTFDFKFTNEDITSVAVAASSSPDFAPATFGSHTGLTLVSPDEFTVDVTGANPAYLSKLIIDVKTGNSPVATPLPAALPLFASGLGTMGLLGWRRKRKAAAIAA